MHRIKPRKTLLDPILLITRDPQIENSVHGRLKLSKIHEF